MSLYKSSTGLLARSLYKLSIGALLARSQYIRALLARSLYKISVRGLLARSLYKLPKRCLLARSLEEMSVGVCTRALSVIFLSARSLYKITKKPYKSSLYKISVRGLLGKISAQTLSKRPPGQDLCARSPRLSKGTPHHTESDLTGPKC